MATITTTTGYPVTSWGRPAETRAIEDARALLFANRHLLTQAERIYDRFEEFQRHFFPDVRRMFERIYERVREAGELVSSCWSRPVRVAGLREQLSGYRRRDINALICAHARLRTMLNRRDRDGGDPPGSVTASLPQRTRGPNSRRSNLETIHHRPVVAAPA